jgi:hypothetical protein
MVAASAAQSFMKSRRLMPLELMRELSPVILLLFRCEDLAFILHHSHVAYCDRRAITTLLYGYVHYNTSTEQQNEGVGQ